MVPACCRAANVSLLIRVSGRTPRSGAVGIGACSLPMPSLAVVLGTSSVQMRHSRMMITLDPQHFTFATGRFVVASCWMIVARVQVPNCMQADAFTKPADHLIVAMLASLRRARCLVTREWFISSHDHIVGTRCSIVIPSCCPTLSVDTIVESCRSSNSTHSRLRRTPWLMSSARRRTASSGERIVDHMLHDRVGVRA
jgi:hypothetical protein